MKKYTKRIASLLLAVICTMALLTGCEKEQVYIPVTTNTIEALQDGRVIGYIVEDFDKDYYDINELEDMVRTEIDAYNDEKKNLSTEAGRTLVIVDKVYMAEDGSKKAVVALNFQNAAVYADYMEQELFYGTVAEAVANGYELDKKLANVKGGDVFAGEQIQKNSEKLVLILKDTVTVRTEGTVQYLSANARLTEDGFVDCTGNDDLKYIIIK